MIQLTATKAALDKEKAAKKALATKKDKPMTKKQLEAAERMARKKTMASFARFKEWQETSIRQEEEWAKEDEEQEMREIEEVVAASLAREEEEEAEKERLKMNAKKTEEQEKQESEEQEGPLRRTERKRTPKTFFD